MSGATGNHPTLVQGAAAADAGERNLTGASTAADVGFSLAAYRWSDGSLAWQHTVAAEGPLPAVHDKHNLASPSPATDADVVIGWFGTGQIVALDHTGKRLWAKHLGREYAPFDLQWGHSSSPVLVKDLVILVCYHGASAYVLALDKRTGAVKWKVDRPAPLLSYSTPLILDGPRGAEIVINTSAGLEAIALDTGEDRWRVVEENRFPIPVPTLADGIIYTTRGYRSGPYVAIRPGGQGDVTARVTLPGAFQPARPYISSLVHYRGLIYTAGELGVVTCLEAKTGERVWQERVGGVFTASPVAADGRIYLVSETGETVVLKAGRTFEILSRNKLDAHFVASPAISRGRIFLRGDNELFAVGK